MNKKSPETKVGDEFTVVVNDGVVLMRVKALLQKGVWMVEARNSNGVYADEYADLAPQIMTDDEVRPHIKRHRFLNSPKQGLA